MGYLALYRKYRPSTFDDLVGQNSVSSIIKNEILSGKISHAYLFSGPRGTGKTSTAKIIAKMINCSNLSADGVPCGKCDSCVNFLSSNDIVEIDAASNNGVDEIRDLRDKVNLVPSFGKYKVYIIDEVHMLTTQAFNALLKTLEEPPSHIVFILATTEFYKIPSTVVSRCQKFQFFKFSVDEIVERLNNICSLENININEDIIYEIARLSDGGMRDAINLLDQINSYGSNVTVDDLYRICGIVSYDYIFSLLEAIFNNDILKIVSYIDEIDSLGVDFDKFIGEVIVYLKNYLLYLKKFEFNDGLKNNIKDFSLLSDMYSLDFVYNLIFSLNDLSFKIKNSSFSNVLLITFFVKLSNDFKKINRNDEFKDENSDVSNIDNTINDMGNNFDALENNNKITKYLKYKKTRINNTFSTASKKNKELFLNKWNDLVSIVDSKDYSEIVGIISDIDVLVVGDNNIIFLVKYNSLMDRIYWLYEKFENMLMDVYKKNYKIVFLTDDEWMYEKENYIKNLKNGYKYTYIVEDTDEESNNFEENKENDVEKIASILGRDIISYD